MYGARILKMGCKDDDDVRDLHIKLIAWGSGSDNDGIGRTMDPVRITKKFDATTRDAVMRFQKAHKLPVNGVVDAAVFRAIDREAAVHPVMVWQLACPCLRKARRKDDTHMHAILCKCGAHPAASATPPAVADECTGFGKGRYHGDSTLAGKKVDTVDISGENKDLYDKEEYPGIDKALLWAARGLMHRAKLRRIRIVTGYSCWLDHYYRLDDTRWEHDQSTFHLGKAMDFCCELCDAANLGDYSKAPCPRCAAVHEKARHLCGFQLGWHEKLRASVAELRNDMRLPASPFAVHLNTVRLVDPKQAADFAQTHAAGAEPLASGPPAVCFPIDLGEGADPLATPSEAFFRHTESKPSGGFPFGRSRLWHGGVHLFAKEGTEVRAIAGGEVVAYLCSSAEEGIYGSRSFVLLRHEWVEEPKPANPRYWYSLYMHLDKEAPDEKAVIRWRKQLYLRGKAHLLGKFPCPLFERKDEGTNHYLSPKNGAEDNECAAALPDEVLELHADAAAAVPLAKANTDAATLDDSLKGLKTWFNQAPPIDPPYSTVVKLVKLKDDTLDTYAFTKLENVVVATLVPGGADLAKQDSIVAVPAAYRVKVAAGEVIGKVAKPPMEPLLKPDGAFVHLEVFSEHQLMTAAGWKVLDLGAGLAAGDRRAAVAKLLAEKLTPEPPAQVLLAADLLHRGDEVSREALRSVVLKMPSLWKIDWTAALDGAKTQFPRTPQQLGLIGSEFEDYCWWTAVATKDNTILPTAATIHHFHPLAFLLALAYA